MGIISKDYRFGDLPAGGRDLITDVPGVKVGHVTLVDGIVQTGVTAVIPGPGSTFRNKFPAAVHVINGFGKSAGLVQIEELGTLETPILLTNTLSVSACLDGLITYMLADHPEIGTTTGTVNCVVGECNDSKVNDIRGRHVTPAHAMEALCKASEDFAEGAVGAGRGMKCFGWSGGIGSASRLVELGGKTYTVGALLLTNFGRKNQFVICGKKAGEPQAGPDEDMRKALAVNDALAKRSYPDISTTSDMAAPVVRVQAAAAPAAKAEDESRDTGSCMMILATDLPLSSRQLKRCAHRAQNGLARCGAQTGGGSGEIVIAFSTANRVPHEGIEAIHTAQYLHEDLLDTAFTAVADCVEESVVSSVLHAETVTGRDGNTLEAFFAGR